MWLAAIGGSLQYGTMQAKMFRVYIIFRKPVKKATVCCMSVLMLYADVFHCTSLIP